jgi:signal peptide peptidase SppA
MGLHLLAARIFGTPLMIAPSKLDAILGAPDIAARLGLQPAPVEGPESEPKERQAASFEGREPAATAELRVAVVQVVGTLANRVSWMDAMSGMTSYETLSEELERLAADPSVHGILLEVDSFGGEAAGVFDVADRIHAARQQKPVFGVANQYAMSAGYALLSQCDRVFVPQSGEVGSIGVVTTHMDLTAAAEKQGVRVTHVHAGAHKVDLSPFKALSPEVRDRLQADVEQIYGQFVAAVERGRGEALTADAIRGTEALTYIGEKAVTAGLADEVGDKAAALSALFAEVEERKAMKDLEAKVAKLEGELATMRAENAALKKAAEERQSRDDAAYLEHLKAKSAEAQNPIDAAKLAKVEAHMKAGRREIARELGDELLEAACAKGGKPARTQGAAAPKAPDHQKLAVSGQARLLREQGYTVVLSDDGSQIVSATPPAKRAVKARR